MHQKQLIGLSVSFVVLTLGFWLVEFFWPSVPVPRKIRRGAFLDAVYYFITSIAFNPLAQVATLLLLAPLLFILGRKLDHASILAGTGPLRHLPLWVQAILFVAVSDFFGYWSHRWFHGRKLWKYHAVHHCSEQLDWLSAARQHPVNAIVMRVCQAVPMTLLGLSPALLAAWVPLITFYTIFIHANVSWTFGPLRYVIATPLFHRWHHTREEEGIDTNFAGLFPFWDMIFGTFYMPVGKVPTEFGVVGNRVPETFWGQMAYPFRAERPDSSAPAKAIEAEPASPANAV